MVSKRRASGKAEGELARSTMRRAPELGAQRSVLVGSTSGSPRCGPGRIVARGISSYFGTLSFDAPPARPQLSLLTQERHAQLLSGAFAVAAPGPAAGPTLAFLELLPGSANAAFPGLRLLCILHPADELVAGQRRDVIPGRERRRMGDQGRAQVFRKLVHDATGHSTATHEITLSPASRSRQEYDVRIARLVYTLSRCIRRRVMVPKGIGHKR